jgi:hypothetical protein
MDCAGKSGDMGEMQIALALFVLAVVIVVLAVRLRATTRVGGSVQLKDASGNRLSIDELLAKELARSGSGKPVVTIAMTTRRAGSGNPDSTEAITIDGQTYHSIDEIPPEVRDRVRTLLAKAHKPGSDPADGANAALIRIEDDLATLGLDLRDPASASEDPPQGA